MFTFLCCRGVEQACRAPLNKALCSVLRISLETSSDVPAKLWLPVVQGLLRFFILQSLLVNGVRLSLQPDPHFFRRGFRNLSPLWLHSIGLSFSPFQNCELNHEWVHQNWSFHHLSHFPPRNFWLILHRGHLLVLGLFGFACTGFSSQPIQWRINSCLVWFPWWLQHGAMDPLEGTHLGECWPSRLLNLHFSIIFQPSNSST